jgi:hypothetical protein
MTRLRLVARLCASEPQRREAALARLREKTPKSVSLAAVYQSTQG